MYQKSQNVTFNKSQILFPGRWAGKCYPLNTNFYDFLLCKKHDVGLILNATNSITVISYW